MSDEKVLTKEIAEQFLADEDCDVDLGEFTAIDDAAAKVLSELKAGDDYHLPLEGLTSLSAAAAESLVKYPAGLDLCSLTRLSNAAEEILRNYQGFLGLDGLETIQREKIKEAIRELSQSTNQRSVDVVNASDVAKILIAKLEATEFNFCSPKIMERVVEILSELKFGIRDVVEALKLEETRLPFTWLPSWRTLESAGAEVFDSLTDGRDPDWPAPAILRKHPSFSESEDEDWEDEDENWDDD